MYLNSSLEDDVQATKRLRLTWDVFKSTYTCDSS